MKIKKKEAEDGPFLKIQTNNQDAWKLWPKEEQFGELSI